MSDKRENASPKTSSPTGSVKAVAKVDNPALVTARITPIIIRSSNAVVPEHYPPSHP